MAAWSKKKKQESAGTSTWVLVGSACVAVGLVAITYGSLWSPQAISVSEGNAMLSWLELYFPYYPFTPFLPTFIIMIGAVLMVRPAAETATS
jgi:hypothetical protein